MVVITVVLNGRELLETTPLQAELMAAWLRVHGWTLEQEGNVLYIERGTWRRRIAHGSR